jgi:ABC-type multidrug transport system ATPase subunit
MGPSGCGKTTLLNIISRRLNSLSVTGDLLLDGAPFDDETLRKTSTFVEQEDHLIGSLTVHETIEFAAKLALSRKASASKRQETVEEMLRAFGLWSVKDSKIGTPLRRGISEGQKRRVTTASQLITQPVIILLGIHASCLFTKLQMNQLPDWTVQAPTRSFLVSETRLENLA